MKELIINGVTVELDDKTKLDLQYVSFLFASISSISAPRSWTVSLPKSAVNISLLQGATSADSTSDFPYDKWTVDYYSEGFRIINNGKAMLLRATNRIEFVFTFGAMFDKIKLLSETKLTELTETSTDFLPWNRSMNFNDMTKGFGWVNWYSFTNEDRSYTTHPDIPYATLHPTVKFSYVMNKIQSFFGITLVGLSAIAGGCSFPLRELDGISVYSEDSSSLAVALNKNNQSGAISFNDVSLSHIEYFTLENDYKYFKSNHNRDTLIEIRFYAEYYGGRVGDVTLRVVDNNGVSRDIATAIRTDVGVFTTYFDLYTLIFEFKSNDSYFYFHRTDTINPDDLVNADCSFTTEVTGSYYEPATTGGYFPIIPNLPDMTCADFIFEAMKFSGKYPRISKDTPNTIDFFSAIEVNNNVPNALDWSDKLVKDMPRISEPSDMEFKFGNYAQKNIMKYKEDKTNLLDTSSFLEVANKNLEEESVLVEMKFAAGKRFSVSDYVVDYPLYDITIQDGLLVKNPITQSNDILADVNLIGAVNTLKFSDTFLFSALKTNYFGDQNLIYKPRFIKEKFNLKPYDVFNFDDTVPIYLKQFGKFYAVMKLQYRDNEFSECELLEVKNITA